VVKSGPLNCFRSASIGGLVSWNGTVGSASNMSRFVMASHSIKCKVHPRTGHGGQEGEQRYSCTLLLTSALD
jgi:hypothetical protein